MNTLIIPFNRDWLFHDGDIILLGNRLFEFHE